MWDPVWEKVFAENEWGKYPAEELIRFIARNFYGVADRGKVKILEIGCGPGANLWYCAREGFQVYGVDGSLTAIERARARLDAEVPQWKGKLLVADITNLDFDTKTMDAFIDNEAVYCNDINDSKKIYREAARTLKPGGRFFIRTFATGSYGFDTGKPIGHNAFICSEGPLKDKGYVRFTAQSEIDELIGPELKVISYEMVSMTYNNLKNCVTEWILVGKKLFDI